MKPLIWLKIPPLDWIVLKVYYEFIWVLDVNTILRNNVIAIKTSMGAGPWWSLSEEYTTKKRSLSLFETNQWFAVATLRMFFRMFLKKNKLYNLIKREIHILTITTTIKKNTQIHKVYNCLLRVFIFWNRCMIVSLSML